MDRCLEALSRVQGERDESTAAAIEAAEAVDSLRRELARQHGLVQEADEARLRAEDRAAESDALLNDALGREDGLLAAHEALLAEHETQETSRRAKACLIQTGMQDRYAMEIGRMRSMWGAAGQLRSFEAALLDNDNDEDDDGAAGKHGSRHWGEIGRAAELGLSQVEKALLSVHPASMHGGELSTTTISLLAEVDTVLAESISSLAAEVDEVVRCLTQSTPAMWDALTLRTKCREAEAELEASRDMLEEARSEIRAYESCLPLHAAGSQQHPPNPAPFSAASLLTPRFPSLSHPPSLDSPGAGSPSPETKGGSPPSLRGKKQQQQQQQQDSGSRSRRGNSSSVSPTLSPSSLSPSLSPLGKATARLEASIFRASLEEPEEQEGEGGSSPGLLLGERDARHGDLCGDLGGEEGEGSLSSSLLVTPSLSSSLLVTPEKKKKQPTRAQHEGSVSPPGLIPASRGRPSLQSDDSRSLSPSQSPAFEGLEDSTPLDQCWLTGPLVGPIDLIQEGEEAQRIAAWHGEALTTSPWATPEKAPLLHQSRESQEEGEEVCDAGSLSLGLSRTSLEGQGYCHTDGTTPPRKADDNSSRSRVCHHDNADDALDAITPQALRSRALPPPPPATDRALPCTSPTRALYSAWEALGLSFMNKPAGGKAWRNHPPASPSSTMMQRDAVVQGSTEDHMLLLLPGVLEGSNEVESDSEDSACMGLPACDLPLGLSGLPGALSTAFERFAAETVDGTMGVGPELWEHFTREVGFVPACFPIETYYHIWTYNPRFYSLLLGWLCPCLLPDRDGTYHIRRGVPAHNLQRRREQREHGSPKSARGPGSYTLPGCCRRGCGGCHVCSGRRGRCSGEAPVACRVVACRVALRCPALDPLAPHGG